MFSLYILDLSGCALFQQDPFQLENVESGPAAGPDQAQPVPGIAVDAKQRFVWTPSVPVSSGRVGESSLSAPIVTNRRIVCAEPSPDAVTAIASSIDASLRGAGTFSGGATAEAAGKIGNTLSETVENIGERTQVIQLLRDSLYRACEAYSNGAIDEFGYSLILGQIDLFMLQLVAADSLGRAKGGEEVAAAQTLVDQRSIAVTKARRSFEEADRKLTALERRRSLATTLQNEKRLIEGDQAALGTRVNNANTELNTLNATIKTERATLEGINTSPAARDALQEQIREKQEALQEADDASKPELQAELNDLQQNLQEEQQRLRVAQAQAQEQRRIVTDLEAQRSALVTRKADDEAALARANTQRQNPQFNSISDAPAKDEIDSAAAARDSARTALSTAEDNLIQAQTALSRATGGLGADAAGSGVLNNLIDRSFKQAESPKPGRVTKAACLQWFARHPDVRMSVLKVDANSEPSAVFKNPNDVPAIAVFCGSFLGDATDKEGDANH